MNGVREKWTDERLDDLRDQVRDGFTRVDADLREIRTEMAANHRVQLQLSVGTIGTTVLGFLGLIVTQL